MITTKQNKTLGYKEMKSPPASNKNKSRNKKHNFFHYFRRYAAKLMQNSSLELKPNKKNTSPAHEKLFIFRHKKLFSKFFKDIFFLKKYKPPVDEGHKTHTKIYKTFKMLYF